MLLFAAHDPGARNHIRPIYDHAKSLGEKVEFVDLSAGKLDDDQALALVHRLQPELLISGCSTNRAEWPLLRASKGLGIKTVAVVDIVAEGKLDLVPPADFPDRFLVTNQHCREEITGYRASPETIIVTGSAYIESVSKRKRRRSEFEAGGLYGISHNANLVSFFCCPNTESSIEAVVSLATVLPKTSLSRPVVVVRPHPRAPHKETLQAVCGRFDHVHFDPGDQIGRHELLGACRFSFSMASTVSLESLVLGTPSAFYQIGWDFREFDRTSRNNDRVQKIRSYEELRGFVATAMDQPGALIPDDIENYQGALRRIWDVISDLRAKRPPK